MEALGGVPAASLVRDPPPTQRCTRGRPSGRRPPRCIRASVAEVAELPPGRVRVGSGDSPLELSRVINGMWQTSSPAWGKADPARVVDAMIAHVDAGLTTFDLADIYGPAEGLYGMMMDKLRRERGEEAATKPQGCTKFCPSPGRMTGSVVEEAVDRSRRKMQVKALDMVQFHWWEYDISGYIDALKHLTDLKEAGKIKAIGLTNFDTRRLQEILEAGIPVATNQVQHSLVDMRPQERMAELCSMTGVKLITYGTVMGGLLSEKFLDVREPGSMMGPKLTTPSLNKYKRMVDAWGGWVLFQQLLLECKVVANKHRVPVSTVAVRHILDQPCVAASMVGVRFGLSEHIHSSRSVCSLELDEEDKERLESVMVQGRDLLDLIGDCGDEYR